MTPDAERYFPEPQPGTNLLGLVKHIAYSAARYFGEVFDRPFPDRVPRWDDAGGGGTNTGRPNTRHTKKSSGSIIGRGSTRTRPLRLSLSTRRVSFRGGRAPM